jgi:beta-N-acetylhexosaminidase
MTLEEKVGQMIMAGFAGTDVSRVRTLIEDYRIGGVILFGRNARHPFHVAELTAELQSISKTPLFIATDQEGGRVQRLQEGFTQFPPFNQLGLSDSDDLAYQYGRVFARELSAVGLNMNMAPVLDVNTNPQNPVIGDRALCSDFRRVARLGSQIIRGLQDNGVMAVGKHFPGHGDTAEDSHETLPRIKLEAHRIREVELVPFREAIAAGVGGIMTAHVLYENLDEEAPASLSYPIINGLLREELGFSSLVLSDDFEMLALDQDELGNLAVKAIQSGTNLLLVCHSQEKQIHIIETILQAIRSGKLNQNHIEKSAELILDMKNRYPPPPIDSNRIEKVVGCAEHKKIIDKIKSFKPFY